MAAVQEVNLAPDAARIVAAALGLPYEMAPNTSHHRAPAPSPAPGLAPNLALPAFIGAPDGLDYEDNTADLPAVQVEGNARHNAGPINSTLLLAGAP